MTDSKLNVSRSSVNRVLDGDYTFLFSAFAWSKTPQGHVHWNRIYSGATDLTDDDIQYLKSLLKEEEPMTKVTTVETKKQIIFGSHMNGRLNVGSYQTIHGERVWLCFDSARSPKEVVSKEEMKELIDNLQAIYELMDD